MIALPSNTVFEGEGEKTVLRISRTFQGERLLSNADFLNGNSNITLRSFLIDGAVPPMKKRESDGILRFENVDELHITDVNISVISDYTAIDLAAFVRNSLVEHCIVSNGGAGGGLEIRNRDRQLNHAVTNITVRNNVFASRNDEPLSVFGWLGQVNNITLESNIVNAQDASFGISAYCIDQPKHTGDLSHVRIIYNTVTGGRVAGIGVKGGARNVIVENNVIKNTTGDGIFLHTGGLGLPNVSDITINNNLIAEAGRHGIFATGTNNTIENNSIRNCKGCGIYSAGLMRIIHNTIINSKPGILVDGSSPRFIRENRLIKSVRILVVNNDNTGIENNIIY